LFAACAFVLASGPSLASEGPLERQECGQDQDQAMAKFAPKVTDEGAPEARACKRWPGSDNLSIAAYLFGAGEYQKLLAVALLNADARVVASYTKTVDSEGDRYRRDSLRLDTAPYKLNAHTRAFGLDVERDQNRHCVEAGDGPERTLFVREGNRLRPVLGPVMVTQWSTVDNGVAFCKLLPESADVVSEHFDLSFAIGPAQTKGYADLVVTGISRYDNGAKSPRAPLRFTWHYDGTRYPDDPMRKALHAWMDVR
jgi:hypothetical protein